jgi:hypothetical protein
MNLIESSKKFLERKEFFMVDKINSDFNELVTKALIVLSKLCVNI